jgi:hypothetical protein
VLTTLFPGGFGSFLIPSLLFRGDEKERSILLERGESRPPNIKVTPSAQLELVQGEYTGAVI